MTISLFWTIVLMFFAFIGAVVFLGFAILIFGGIGFLIADEIEDFMSQKKKVKK